MPKPPQASKFESDQYLCERCDVHGLYVVGPCWCCGREDRLTPLPMIVCETQHNNVEGGCRRWLTPGTISALNAESDDMVELTVRALSPQDATGG